MIIDLAPLVQALAALALAAITAATPYLAPLLRRYLNISLTATQAAYGYTATSAANFRDATMRNEAIAKGVQHVMSSTPNALAALGITPDHVKGMVEARFGGLLAADPSVSIGDLTQAAKP